MHGTGIGLVWDESSVGQLQPSAQLSYWNDLHSYPIDDFNPNRAEEFFWRWWHSKPSCNCEMMDLQGGPDVSSGERFFGYGINLHNRVNLKLDDESNDARYYPEVSYWDALAMWHPDVFFRSWAPCHRLVIMLAVGKFRQLARYTAQPAREYAQKCKADFLLITNQTMQDWKREKFRVWDYARHYHEVLFVDADLIIKPNCPSIFDSPEVPPNVSVAMVDDMPYAIEKDGGHWIQPDYTHCLALQGMPSRLAERLLNSGFVFTRGRGHEIWQPPDRPLGESHCAEQWWIQYQAESSGLRIVNLDPLWNWQSWYPSFESKRSAAWVEHYSGIPFEQKLAELKQFSATP